MSVMDRLFNRPASAGTPSTAAPPNPGAPAPAPAAPGSGDPTEVVVVEKQDDSPLAAFKGFWDTPVDKNGKPVVQTDPLSVPVFNFDPKKVQEQAKNLDFVKDVNPELMAKVAAGGADSIPALMELLNFVQQNSFAAATLTMGNMVNEGLAVHSDNLRKALPRDVQRLQLASTAIDDEILEHPAVVPLVNALRKAAFNKDPNANPAEVAKNVNAYINGIATAVADKKAKATTAEATGTQTNWGNYFGDTGQPG
jgi:hypothetical protein